MILVLQDKDNTVYVIDQSNKTDSGWHDSIDEALHNMRHSTLNNAFFTESLEWFISKYLSYNVYYLDNYNTQPYIFW